MFQWVNGWLGEQMVADPRSGMLLSNKKGRTTDTQNNMDEVQIYYASEFHLCSALEETNYMVTEDRSVSSRDWR